MGSELQLDSWCGLLLSTRVCLLSSEKGGASLRQGTWSWSVGSFLVLLVLYQCTACFPLPCGAGGCDPHCLREAGIFLAGSDKFLFLQCFCLQISFLSPSLPGFQEADGAGKKDLPGLSVRSGCWAQKSQAQSFCSLLFVYSFYLVVDYKLAAIGKSDATQLSLCNNESVFNK